MSHGPILEKNVSASSGNLILTATTKPSIPSASQVAIWAQDIGDRILPCVVDGQGLTNNLQLCVGRTKIGTWSWMGNATTATIGPGIATPQTNGTATTVNVATTSALAATRRLQYLSAATNPSSASIRHNALQFFLGNATDRGGFMMVMRFGPSDAASRGTVPSMFCGMIGVTTLLTAIDTTLTNLVGVCQLAGSTNMQIIHNDGTGTATTIDLGTDFPCNLNTELYEVTLACPPNATTIGYQVKRFGTAFEANGTISTNLPSNTQLLTPQLTRINNAANTVAMDYSSVYIESFV
jgi:hypothetical protein